MNLWILHHYATLPNLNGHIRPFRFAKHLEKYGIRTIVFAASFQHMSSNNLISDDCLSLMQEYDGIPFVFVNTPSSVAGMRARIRNMFMFYRNVLQCAAKYAGSFGKPDVILASSPHPLAIVAGIKLGKKYGVPCIGEVRDLWPEAIFSMGYAREKSLLGRLLTVGEHWLYKKSGALVFLKEGDTDHLAECGWTLERGGDISLQKCFYVNNGIELDEYDRDRIAYQFPDADLDDDSFKVIYAGTIRPVNNVGNIVDAAKLLQGTDVKILIYGDGTERLSLERRVDNEHIGNVVFKGFVQKKYLPYILSKSSANLLNYSSEHYNWSRGNSSNKLFEYLASGRPVIATIKTGYSIIQRYNCGTEMEQQTPEGLAQAILHIKNLGSKEYEAYCANARRGAADFDYKILTERLMQAIRYVTA